MKRALIVTFAAPAAIILLVSCALPGAALSNSPDEKAADVPATENGNAPVNYALTANNDFALDLYKALASENRSPTARATPDQAPVEQFTEREKQVAKENLGKNYFCSPYSLSSALAMTAEGARGTTAREMGRVLRFPEAVRQLGDDARSVPWKTAMIHAGIAAMNERLNAPQQPYELHVANALWGDKTHPLLPAYVGTIEKFYHTGGVFPIDFAKAEAARLRINAWVEGQTVEKIKELIPREGIPPEETKLVLTNAIYFKGDWERPFHEAETRKQDFMVSATGKVKALLMHRCRTYPYADDGAVQALELPYKGGALSMLVLLPKKTRGLRQLEDSLSSKKLGDLRSRLRPTLVDVRLPKFKLEASYALKGTLMAMGMLAAFSRQAADFSGIDGEGKLYIYNVFHKAFVEVNEQGTEAAAASAVVAAKAEDPPPAAKFHANHPFLFMICDRRDSNILFLGRMMNPATASEANDTVREHR